MARMWTRLHEFLGQAPGPVTFAMVRQAAAANMPEFDDFDWKEKLPQPPRDGRWNELAKDISAMANTRGGLIVFGATDKTTDLVGIDPDEVNTQQYAQWVRNHVQPYLPDVDFTPLSEGGVHVLVVDVPASPMAPHHVYGTAAKDRDQQAAVVPYRDKDHTAWMAEHQIERAYRDRFTRAERTEQDTRRLLDRDRVLAPHSEPAAWIFAVARPSRPLPVTAPRLSAYDATEIVQSSRPRVNALAAGSRSAGPLRALEMVTRLPRPGLRSWVLSTVPQRAGGAYAELHDDGSLVVAANLSWSLHRERIADLPEHEHVLVCDELVRLSCVDALVMAQSLASHLRIDGIYQLTASITVTPAELPMVPVITQPHGFYEVPVTAHHPLRITPVTTSLSPLDEIDTIRQAAEDLFRDLMNQFGFDPGAG
ncbi:RNA-binding domain-containing protein [Streptomyces sp. DW26H14]|uniref:RNA-binding domain-containing protein n=1 Tax=Streptomyces sp. DW26H14 TaxID=3435395 RepID=UPI00403DA0B3